jgi:hypothetical protein
MVARATEAQSGASGDELLFSNDAVSLCLLTHRHQKTMRVIDFRAGPSPRKRASVLQLAQRQGIDKVFTLVERDEVSTWTKLGFTKEGNIPGFYKRSDAFLLGCDAHEPAQSELRLPTVDEADDDDDVPALPRTPAHQRAEKTVAHARRVARQLAERPTVSTKIVSIDEADARRAAERMAKAGRALTRFERFGRDVTRRYFLVTARGGFELVASVESQPCFGNAFLELLTAPRTDAEAAATASAVRAMCEKLLAEGSVSCFSLAPSDDVALCVAFVHAGFRRTGLLSQHLLVGNRRRDAILWSRKLANPMGD